MEPVADHPLAFAPDPRLFRRRGGRTWPRRLRQPGAGVLDDVLQQATAALLPDVPGLSAGSSIEVERAVGEFLSGQFHRMPMHLHAGCLAMLLWMRIASRFSRPLDPRDVYRACAVSWQRSRVPGLRQFIRLLRSCALLRFYSHPLVLARLGSPVPSRMDGA